MRKIIIHAGWPKTGTSSVQNALFENRDALLAQEGILYPSIANFQSRMLVTMFRENASLQPTNRMKGVLDESGLTKLASEYKKTYEKEINNTNWKTLIISAEGLKNFDLPELKKFKSWVDGFSKDQTVYFLVREPVKYTASAIQQFLKSGHTLDLMYKDLPQAVLPGYEEKISDFISVFGKENIKVETFEAAVKHPNGLVGYFVEKWGIGQPLGKKLSAEARHDNSSLSLLSAEILSSINRQRPLFIKNKRGSDRTVTELKFLKKYNNGPKFRLPDHVILRIRDITQSDLDWLLDTYNLRFPMRGSSQQPGPVDEVANHENHQNFIDSVAIMISDLLNERHYLRLKERANRLRSKGEKKQAEATMAEARRIFPDGK